MIFAAWKKKIGVSGKILGLVGLLETQVFFFFGLRVRMNIFLQVNDLSMISLCYKTDDRL